MKKLKIKKEVELNELEKFGLVYNDNSNKYEYHDGFLSYVIVNCWNREVFFSQSVVIFDLINAGIIEKVGC